MSLALKYRPSSFKDVVGQKVLVQILQNSFITNNIPSAILLSGCSGVGKTSIARIISLCLNCKLGPIFDPCGSCENCIDIIASNHPDVIEIDAASNTGVDDIRIILENAHYLPISAKFKVYIIDEVHMLSINAFNALLKTLEEPISNVKFILATTELRKIPITIISRCQHFDLKKISTPDIINRLKFITLQENIKCDEFSLSLIAQNADNSMRSALFILEQAALYNNNVISKENIYDLLGIVESTALYDLLSAIIQSNPKIALQILKKLLNKTDPIIILENLLSFIHQSCYNLIDNNTSNTNNLITNTNPVFLSRLWQALFKGLQEVKTSKCNIAAAEMVIIRLCYLSNLPPLAQIIKKLQHHEDCSSQKNTLKSENPEFQQILNLLNKYNQIILYNHLYNDVELISCVNNCLIVKPKKTLINDFSTTLSKFLSGVTNVNWSVIIKKDEVSNIDQLNNEPAVKNILQEFQGAKIVDIN